MKLLTVGNFLIIVFCSFYMILMTISKDWHNNIYMTVENFNCQSVIHDTVLPKSEPPKPNVTKYILLWTRFFETKNWNTRSDGVNDIDQDYFARIKCHTHNCVVTSDRGLLKSTLDYDAMVFHSAEQWSDLGPIPVERSAHQSYVMAILESPVNTWHEFQKDRDFYNITMTYRRDSDVIWQDYGVFIDRQTGKQVAPLRDGLKPIWQMQDENFFDQHIYDQVTKKTKMGAWFVSNCNTLSRREQLVEALQRHIPVDVYGKCGPHKCPRHSNHCDDLLDKDYKFYMAFENSICEDYITEKFFGTMKRLVVPVVYGGADYSLFAPPHSYIDANDFASVDALAEYLMFLDRNPREYVKYFWWKQFYRIEEPSPFCDLCQKLHTTANRGVGQYYSDIESWWKVNQCKAEARINF